MNVASILILWGLIPRPMRSPIGETNLRNLCVGEGKVGMTRITGGQGQCQHRESYMKMKYIAYWGSGRVQTEKKHHIFRVVIKQYLKDFVRKGCTRVNSSPPLQTFSNMHRWTALSELELLHSDGGRLVGPPVWYQEGVTEPLSGRLAGIIILPR